MCRLNEHRPMPNPVLLSNPHPVIEVKVEARENVFRFGAEESRF